MRLIYFLLLILFLMPLATASSKNCDIYVMDGNSWNGKKFKDRYMQKAYKELLLEKLSGNIVKANNLQEMQNGINQYLNNNKDCCIRRLVLIGHGSSGIIAMGSGKTVTKTATDTQHMSETNKNLWEPIFTGIQKKFCPKEDSVRSGVFLYGCRTGCCQDGANLIYHLGLSLDMKADVYGYVSGVKTQPSTKSGYLGSMLTTLEKIPSKYIKYFNKDWASVPYPSCTKCSKGNYTPRKYKPAKVAVYQCSCDSMNWEVLQNCVDTCQASLGCFSGICNEKEGHDVEAAPTYAYNPVFTNGTAADIPASASSSLSTDVGGAWEAGGVSNPDIFIHDGIYHMYYNAWTATGTEVFAIGLARSIDGINWERDPQNPVLTVPSSGDWQPTGVWGAGVIQDEGKFKMWFTAEDTDSARAIGYAEGVQPNSFTADSKPVLSSRDGYSYDAYGMWNPEVIRDGDHLKMYYVCTDGYYWDFCLATSTDGRKWSRHPDNPVFLTNSDSSAWDGWYIYSPSVVKVGNKYHMFYTGRNSLGVEHIGYAKSTDGINWTRSPNNPILFSDVTEDWNNYGIAHSDVIYREVEETFLIYFRGVDEDDNYAIGMAGAPALEEFALGGSGFSLLHFLPAIVGKKHDDKN